MPWRLPHTRELLPSALMVLLADGRSLKHPQIGSTWVALHATIYHIKMDPVSIIGLTAAIQQILKSVYNFTQGVRESKSEINQLCSEMLALKAALEHIQINLSLDDDSGTSKAASPFLSSPNFSTPEFKDMVSSAQAILMDLRARLEVKPSRLKTSLQRMAWPLVKDDVQRYVERLHRLTSWFVLTAISDNT